MDKTLAVGIKITASSHLEGILSHLPGYIYWKNKYSQYVWCNDNFARLASLNCSSEIFGKTEHDFTWTKGIAAKLLEDDQMAIQQAIKTTKEYRCSQAYWNDPFRSMSIERIPLYNETEEICGLLAFVTGMINPKSVLRFIKYK